MKNYLSTRISEMLGIKYPIIQGGMAWIADHNLASAVSNAGGLGVIAAGNAKPDVVRREICLTRELTNNNFGVNLMLTSPWVDEIIKILVSEGVKIITTGAGNPGRIIPGLKALGKLVVPVVASVSQAKLVEREGADAVIAEGMEAGGHIGHTTTMVLVPQIVDAISIPVIAAGGIADSRGYVAAKILGAEGVQIGTRFLLSTEAKIHDNYKQKIISARDTDTTITGLKIGHPVRSIKNQMTRKYLKIEGSGESGNELVKLTMDSLRRASQDGDVETGTVMAGQISGMLKTVQPCSMIIKEIIDGAVKLLE